MIALFALICGAMVQIIQKYRLFNAIGWVFMIAGFGIATLFKADDSTAKWVGYQIVVAAGMGVLVCVLRRSSLYLCISNTTVFSTPAQYSPS